MTSELKPCQTCGNQNIGAYLRCKRDDCPDNQYSGHKRNTHAVPDAPELVRYTLWHTLGRFTASPDGEYVRYDQAVTVIAAKDDRLRKSEQDKVGMLAHIAELEAKLAQIEKPSPYIDRFTDDDGDTTIVVTEASAPTIYARD